MMWEKSYKLYLVQWSHILFFGAQFFLFNLRWLDFWKPIFYVKILIFLLIFFLESNYFINNI